MRQEILPGFDRPQTAASPGLEVQWRHIDQVQIAREAIAALHSPVGLDLETTGLDPLEAQARLLSLSDGVSPVLVIDLPAVGGLGALRDALLPLAAVAHNASFDMSFLAAAGVRMVLHCSLLAWHALTNRRVSLARLAQELLRLELDKSLQISDWSGALAPEQLRYAALDALCVRQIFPILVGRLREAQRTRVYQLQRNAQLALLDMELHGIGFDRGGLHVLVEGIARRRDALALDLAQALGGINPSSGRQLGHWVARELGATPARWPRTPGGQLRTGADEFLRNLDLLGETARSLVTDRLLPFKDLDKKLSAFGMALGAHVHPRTGRLHPRYSLAGTNTGRMSCGHPNLHQIPRERAYRSLFRAPPGRCLVIADYSQVELRTAAHLAPEPLLLEAYARGQDTHRLTGAMILGKPEEEVSAAERQLAKAVNFGLLFGQGARGLRAYAAASYGVNITEAQAAAYREAWFDAYPGFRSWHRRSAQEAARSLQVSTVAGRVLRWQTREDISLPSVYNFPVQGSAAEVMLAALQALEMALRDIDAFPVAVIHDEIVLECAQEIAPVAALRLCESMRAGMRALFPQATLEGLVEARVGASWADK